MTGLVFLKFGGSLITDKDQAHTPRLDVIHRLAEEVAQARAQSPDLRILLGHGSGSFGHTPARRYNTRAGVSTPAGWTGFAEVWAEARALNQIVVEALVAAGLPVIAFPPSAWVVAKDGSALEWNAAPIRRAKSLSASTRRIASGKPRAKSFCATSSPVSPSRTASSAPQSVVPITGSPAALASSSDKP